MSGEFGLAQAPGGSVSRLERELGALQAVASACLEESCENRLLERITEIMCRTFGIRDFGVVLFDPATGFLHDHPSARRGPEAEALFLRPGEGLVGTAAVSGRVLCVPDVRREPLYRAGDAETLSELVVPLRVDGQTLGVINCESPVLDAFSEEDVRLLTILAGHLATALARLRSLELIRTHEAQYRAMFENGGHAMMSVGEDSTITLCNPAFEELAGCSRARIEGRMTWMDFVALEEDLARIAEYRQRRWTDPAEAPTSYEYVFRPVEGELKHVLTAISVIPGTRKVLAILTDITARRQMEAALVASERRYHALFNNVPVGLYRLDLEGRYIEANQTLLQMHGFQDLVFFARHPACHYFARPEDHDAWRQELMIKGFSRREVERVRQDGTTFWVDEHTQLHREPGLAVHIDGIAIDITERRRAEAESDLLKERLKNSEKFEAIGQLAGGIAHDFNNQLTIIMGFADALAELAADDLQVRYAESITRSCQRSAEITGQLLAFARKAKLVSVPLDLHELILETIALLECSFDKNIQIRHSLEAGVAIVQGDPNLLQNALMNLAINARDAMPEGGELVFSTWIRELGPGECADPACELAPGPYMVVSVEDTGIGMDAETQRRVFEPFFTTKEPGKGTGLGLASVYGTVKQHKGSIRIQSALGQGCRIILGLPLADSSLEKPAAAPGATPVTGTEHILIVDDEDLMLDMFRGMFAPLDYQVTTFNHPIEAIEFFREAHASIDLVLLDLVMPGMGGEDLFLAMRVIDPEVRIVLASGFTGEGEAQRMLDAGAQGCLRKPFRKGELLAEIRRVLQG